MFIAKKHLNRRTLLRGVGVSLALPLLDSMFPALTPIAKAAATQRIPRFVGLFTLRCETNSWPTRSVSVGLAPHAGSAMAWIRIKLRKGRN